MKIRRRTKDGWSERVENKNKLFCDICGDKLWVAPDGKTVYCNGKYEECKSLSIITN